MFLPCFCSHVRRKQSLVLKAGAMLVSITSILLSASLMHAQLASVAMRQNLMAEVGPLIDTAADADGGLLAVPLEAALPEAPLISQARDERPAPVDNTGTLIVPQISAQPVNLVEPDASAAERATTEPVLVDAETWPAYFSTVNAALADVETARGRFTQLDPDGGIATGAFALRRPGRLRFEYDAPNPVLIVSDGVTVAISDSELETVDRLPLQSTPLKFLLDDQIDFDETVETLKIVEAAGFVSLTVRDSSGDVDGELTLIMSSADYQLIGWIAIGSDGEATHVNLDTEEMNTRLSPALFRLDQAFEDDDEDTR